MRGPPVLPSLYGALHFNSLAYTASRRSAMRCPTAIPLLYITLRYGAGHGRPMLYPILPLLSGTLHYIALLGTHNYAPRLLFFSILCRPLLPFHFRTLVDIAVPALHYCHTISFRYASLRFLSRLWTAVLPLLTSTVPCVTLHYNTCVPVLYCQSNPLLYPALLCAALLGHALLPFQYSSLPYATIPYITLLYTTLLCTAVLYCHYLPLRYSTLLYATVQCIAQRGYALLPVRYPSLHYSARQPKLYCQYHTLLCTPS